MQMAFHVVNFGMSPSEAYDLTRTEKAFIRKEWENKKVLDTNLLHKAVFTAVYNIMRGKGKSAMELWGKKASIISAKQKIEYTNSKEKLIEYEKKHKPTWRNKMRAEHGFKPKNDGKKG